MIEIFEDSVWQMSLGERAAIEGVLCALKPALAVEIGTAEGASLRRIAAHAGEVHSFDLVAPQLALPDNVRLHTGDSHALLPQVLQEFADAGRNVDFALVDGDHSAEGVRADVMALLGSPAVGTTLIVAHDTTNEEVRAGLDAVPYEAYPKVAHVDLDFVPGHLGRDRFHRELWYGLGLIVVAADRPAYGAGRAVQTDREPSGKLLALARDVLSGQAPDANGQVGALAARVAEVERRAVELQALAEHHRAVVQDLMTSASWRVTAPLRAAKRVAAGLRRP